MSVVVREFLLALALSLGLTYLSQRLTPLLGLVDRPDDVHKHHGRTVAIGGWAVAVTMVPVFFLVGTRELLGLVFFGSLIALGTGLIDDRFGLSPRAKLLGQLLAAIATVAGWVIHSVNLFGFEISLGWLAIPLTLFWIVGAINAFNLIDGLDGLAAGGALIIFGATALLAWQGGNETVLGFSLGLVGALFGFLFFNWAPARVFLGDGGTHFLGYWLAILSIQATQTDLSASPSNVPIVVSMLLLSVPIVDTAWAILRRLLQGRPIFQADRGHLHHRFLGLGWGERATVLILYAIFVLLCGVAVVVGYFF